MPSIQFGFAIYLDSHERRFIRPNGPLFHRWLPDGEKDALTLPTGDSDAVLLIWFRRRGFAQPGGFIIYDQDKQEIDPSIMEKQAVLDSGPLIGMLTLSNISEEELINFKGSKINDDAYIKIGKRIVRLMVPPVAKLIQILRVYYGQYWLKELAHWDSRTESLGSYCASTLQLRWRLKQEDSWKDFTPTKQEISLVATMPSDDSYKQFLQKEEYFGLSDLLSENYAPSLSAIYLAQAHQSYNEGALSYAFVEANTSLELAISARIQTAYKSSKALTDTLGSFLNLPVRAQLVSIMSIIGNISLENLELALAAIDIRNRIVHEGYVPAFNEENCKALDALMIVLTSLVPGPAFKFPSADGSNKLYND